MIDYEKLKLPPCQYPVGLAISGPKIKDQECGDIAIYKVWWDDPENGMLLCQYHFDFVMAAEKSNSK